MLIVFKTLTWITSIHYSANTKHWSNNFVQRRPKAYWNNTWNFFTSWSAMAMFKYLIINRDRGGWKYLTGCDVVLRIMCPVIQIDTSHGIIKSEIISGVCRRNSNLSKRHWREKCDLRKCKNSFAKKSVELPDKNNPPVSFKNMTKSLRYGKSVEWAILQNMQTWCKHGYRDNRRNVDEREDNNLHQCLL